MEFVNIIAEDTRKITALLSRAAESRCAIIHTHGFGGDGLSNKFVQKMHSVFPKRGVDFISYNGRMSAYLSESYEDNCVNYSGSSVIEYNDILLDLRALMDVFRNRYDNIILQGHSFGTNVVKLYARTTAWKGPLICLSPADSVALYRQWFDKNYVASPSPASSGKDVRWTLLGISTSSVTYELPISEHSCRSLLKSDVFYEWSKDNLANENECLLMLGGDDTVSNFGMTAKSSLELRAGLKWKIVVIEGARHLFTNFEDELVTEILEWLRSLGLGVRATHSR